MLSIFKKNIYDHSKINEVISHFNFPSQWNVVYEVIESFVKQDFEINFEFEMAVPNQHYLVSDLDKDKLAIATDAEKLLALCIAGEYLNQFAQEKIYKPIDTGTFRAKLEQYVGLRYLESISIGGQRVRNFMVGKMASQFILKMQDYSPEAHFVFSRVIVQYSSVVAADSFFEIIKLIQSQEAA